MNRNIINDFSNFSNSSNEICKLLKNCGEQNIGDAYYLSCLLHSFSAFDKNLDDMDNLDNIFSVIKDIERKSYTNLSLYSITDWIVQNIDDVINDNFNYCDAIDEIAEKQDLEIGF